MENKKSSSMTIYVSLIAAMVSLAFAIFAATITTGDILKQASAQKPDEDGCYYLVAPAYYVGLDEPRPPGKYCRDI
jgi:flagellar basal body-associated protein FliL